MEVLEEGSRGPKIQTCRGAEVQIFRETEVVQMSTRQRCSKVVVQRCRGTGVVQRCRDYR